METYKEFLNTEFECECGKKHYIPIKKIIIDENAIKNIPELLSSLTTENKVFVIFDKNTYQAAGESVCEVLTDDNYKVKPIMLSNGSKEENVIPDPDSLFTILENIDDKGYVIACGSGTINDLTAYVSSKLNRPYSIVGTAPSMDGYASSVATLTINGVKKTFPINPPEAIVADLNVLKEAPWELIQSGFGDLLGKITSLIDWKIGNILFDEFYCERAVNIVKSEIENIVKISVKLKDRSEKSIEILIRGLISSGLAMYMAGNSRPASGSEHHISHFLDMYSHLYEKTVPLHGLKVGLGLYLTSTFYLKLLKHDFSQVQVINDKEKRLEDIKKIYKSRSKVIVDYLNQRWDKQKLSKELLIEKEDELKNAIINEIDYLQNCRHILNDVGIIGREDIETIDLDWLKDALKYGFEIRPRYTLVTMLKQINYLDDWAEDAIAEYVNDRRNGVLRDNELHEL